MGRVGTRAASQQSALGSPLAGLSSTVFQSRALASPDHQSTSALLHLQSAAASAAATRRVNKTLLRYALAVVSMQMRMDSV